MVLCDFMHTMLGPTQNGFFCFKLVIGLVIWNWARNISWLESTETLRLGTDRVNLCPSVFIFLQPILSATTKYSHVFQGSVEQDIWKQASLFLNHDNNRGIRKIMLNASLFGWEKSLARETMLMSRLESVVLLCVLSQFTGLMGKLTKEVGRMVKKAGPVRWLLESKQPSNVLS